MKISFKITAIFFLFFFFYPLCALTQVTFTGYEKEPIRIKAEASMGLNEIIVVYSIQGLSIVYESNDIYKVEWLEYSSMGAAYSNEVKGLIRENDVVKLNEPIGNRGYVINDSGKSYSFWLVDYSTFPLVFSNLSLNEDSGCESTILDFKGECAPIDFYTINGKREILSRDITLSYNTLFWDTDKFSYIEERVTKTLPYLTELITVSPGILSATKFELYGDRFTEAWGLGKYIESEYCTPVAVSVETSVEYDKKQDNASNEIGFGNFELGGSAPFTAKFLSFVTDAVVHFEWQIATDQEFENINNRFYDQDITYTFTDEGTTYLRFIGSNSDGTCESISDTFEVSIGASELKIPNAFSPNGDGINDIWKVAYRSLLEFKCWIFDRHGHNIFYFDNPAEGWDGKNGTKFVKPGVYYYIIEAVGTDGKTYKKSGDINILNSKEYNRGSHID